MIGIGATVLIDPNATTRTHDNTTLRIIFDDGILWSNPCAKHDHIGVQRGAIGKLHGEITGVIVCIISVGGAICMRNNLLGVLTC